LGYALGVGPVVVDLQPCRCLLAVVSNEIHLRNEHEGDYDRVVVVNRSFHFWRNRRI
jgi:hypothetical protein